MINSWQQLSEYKCEPVCSDLRICQQHWLKDCLYRNQDSLYGRKYHFSQIRNSDDYRSRVPLCSYEEIAEFINSIEQGRADVLFSGTAVAFERTSGSREGPKLVPYSQQSLLDFRKAILPWLSQVTRRHHITNGTSYWTISPATRQAEMTTGGIPVGLADVAYLGEDVIPFFTNVSAVPHWVGSLSEVDEWQLTTLFYLVSRADLVLFSVWSPTFLLSLLDALETRKFELLQLLKDGKEINDLQLQANPSAVDRLEKYYSFKDTAILWPELKLISCWADASSYPFYEQLQRLFPGIAIQAKGLLSTEGVVTVPDENDQTVLTADSGFYEFLDNQSASKLAHELEQGESYEVIMTTAGGLYRYRTGDTVVCHGYSKGLPILHFTGRNNCTADLVGEKLSDEFVQQCLAGIAGFRMIIPVVDRPGYQLVLDRQEQWKIESIVNQVEQHLSINPHYAYARSIGQLQMLQALVLDNPMDIYMSSKLHAGTRLGDIKLPSLCLKPEIFADQVGAAA